MSDLPDGAGPEAVPDEPGPDPVDVVPPEWVVTLPGRYDGMPEPVYHADPVPGGGSLSSTGARRLLPPSCPALFRYAPHKRTRRLELGTAAHGMVLGTGAPLHVINAPDWKKKAPRDEADAARAAGAVPVLVHAHDTIKAMAAKIEEHATARLLLAPGSGLAEQSVFWLDPETGMWRRCRIDFLPWGANGLIILPDYKTCASAAPDAVAAAAARYGYHQQGAWYADAVRFLCPGVEVRFCLVCQEVTPPFLVETYYLHPSAILEGIRRNRLAIEIWRDCTETGIWPGYNPEQTIETIRLPRWAVPDEDW
jgi:PDDEXK-like domain of unknown function (DUF3799)